MPSGYGPSEVPAFQNSALPTGQQVSYLVSDRLPGMPALYSPQQTQQNITKSGECFVCTSSYWTKKG